MQAGPDHEICFSAHVLLERGVMMGVAMFFAGFVFMLGLLMAGDGCADLVDFGKVGR